MNRINYFHALYNYSHGKMEKEVMEKKAHENYRYEFYMQCEYSSPPASNVLCEWAVQKWGLGG